MLKTKCTNVIGIDVGLRNFINAMTQKMYASEGVGLAAPQVGSLLRVITIDQSAGESGNELMTLINPTITWFSPELTTLKEQCLSLPGLFLHVKRSIACDVEYIDLFGNLNYERFTNFKACIVQHEFDHINGMLMVDRVGPLARDLALKNLSKTKEEEQ